ncbi:MULTISPECIES: hypothetical protein [Rhizobium]|uniref:hypothetical protein n=1 Tax=Rhizobium TaxID=379 RepID=UPI001931D3B8|nr:hypothetical protein [Rhizobium rosettiformans]
MSRISSKRNGKVPFATRYWLIVCISTFLAASAFLYGTGHVHAFPVGEAQYGVQTSNFISSFDHGHPAPCDDEERGDGNCCVAHPGCGICAPLPSQSFAAALQVETFGVTTFPALEPGGAQRQLRPPRLFVTA